MNAAVLGVGNMGRHHARVYAAMPGVNLVAVADVSRTLGQRVAAKSGCKYYKDYKQLLDSENIDAVSIAVPTSLHKTVALECIRRKVPVLIEKPIADTVASAQAIIRSGEKHGVPVCIGHIERFNPTILKLRKLIEQKRFGRIISISSKRVGLFPPQIKDTDVIIDFALDRLPHAKFSESVINAAEEKTIDAYIAWHTVSNFYYMVAAASGDKKSRLFLKELLQFVNIVETSTTDVLAAIDIPLSDFEDALQVAAAISCSAKYPVRELINKIESLSACFSSSLISINP